MQKIYRFLKYKTLLIFLCLLGAAILISIMLIKNQTDQSYHAQAEERRMLPEKQAGSTVTRKTNIKRYIGRSYHFKYSKKELTNLRPDEDINITTMSYAYYAELHRLRMEDIERAKRIEELILEAKRKLEFTVNPKPIALLKSAILAWGKALEYQNKRIEEMNSMLNDIIKGKKDWLTGSDKFISRLESYIPVINQQLRKADKYYKEADLFF